MVKDKHQKKWPSVSNKKAMRDFDLLERFEAGLVLTGSEVKSLREGQVDLEGAYARVEGGECWLIGSKIAPYKQAGIGGHDPDRKRKLLLHKAQIRKLGAKLQLKGLTLIPVRVYFGQSGFAKAELALAKGRRQYDKRRSIIERDQQRQIDRHLRGR